MTFLHSFPRVFATRTDDISPTHVSHENTVMSRGIEILRSISTFGLICTPEWLRFPVHKRQGLDGPDLAFNLDLGRFSQSRFCVTAVNVTELHGGYVQSGFAETKHAISHANVFGPFAIGFSDDVAREIGFMPTIYFSPKNSHGVSGQQPSYIGLNSQLLQSLLDIRNVIKSLLILEHAYSKRYKTNDLHTLDLTDTLDDSGEDLPALENVKSLDKRELDLLTQLFDFKRLPALYLLDHLEIILSLFQSTEDIKSDVPLNFFRQREWRLVQHFRSDLYWYSLGDHAELKDENRLARLADKTELRIKLKKLFKASNEYLNACWVLESVDRKPIRDLVSFVSAPIESLDLIEAKISDLFPNAEFLPAEDLGFKE